MTRKAYLKRAVYCQPLAGRRWMAWGGLVMLIWALWEGMLRFDAMDGMTQAYFQLARSQGTPLMEALKIIWETPQARKDWLNIVYLALIAGLALATLALHRRWKPGFVLIPACVAVFLFHTGHSPLMQLMNLFEGLKAVACGMIAFGAGANIVCALSRLKQAQKRLAEEKKKSVRLAHGTSKTLIPARKKAA